MTPSAKNEVNWFTNSSKNWLDTSKASDVGWVAQFRRLSAEAINEITLGYGLNFSYQWLLTAKQVNGLSQQAITFIVTTLRDSLSLEDKHSLTASTITKMLIGLNSKSSWAMDGGNSWIWQIKKEQVQQLNVQGGVALYKFWTNNNKTHPNYGEKDNQQRFKDQTFIDQFRALSSTVINDLIEYGNQIPVQYQKLLSVEQLNNLSQSSINAIYTNLVGFLSDSDIQTLTPNTAMRMLSSLNKQCLSHYDGSNKWVRQLTEEQVSQLNVSGAIELYTALVKDIATKTFNGMSLDNQALFVKLIQWINPDSINGMMEKTDILSVVLNQLTYDQLYSCSSDAILKQLVALNATASWAGDGQNKWLWQIREAQVSQLSNECSIELFKAWTNKYTNDVYGQNLNGTQHKDEKVVAQFRSINGHAINALILKDNLAPNFAGLLTVNQTNQLSTQSITTQLKKLNKVSWVGGPDAVGAWIWKLTETQVSQLGVEGGVALHKAWTQGNNNLLYVRSKTSGNFDYQTAITQFRALSADVISALVSNKFDVDLRYDYQKLLTGKQLNGLSQEDIKKIYPTIRSSMTKEDVQALSVSKLTDMLLALDSDSQSWAGDGKNGWLWYMTDAQVSQLGVDAGFRLYKAWTNNNNFGYGDNIGGDQYENKRVREQFRALNADVINAIIDKRFGYGMHWAYQRLLSANQLNGLTKKNINLINPTLRSQSDRNADIPKLTTSALSNMLFEMNAIPESWAGDGKNGWLWYITDAQVSQLGVDAGLQLYKAWTHNNTDFGYGDNIGGTQYENQRVREQFRALNADVINAIIDKRFGYGMHWAYQRLLNTDRLNSLSRENINLIYPTLRSRPITAEDVASFSTSTLSNMLFALNESGSWAGDGKNGWLWNITEAQIGQLTNKASDLLYRAWTNNNTNLFYARKNANGNYNDAKVVSQFRALSSDYINIMGRRNFARAANWGTIPDDDKLDIDIEYLKLLSLNQISRMDRMMIRYIDPVILDILRTADITSLSESNINTLINNFPDPSLFSMNWLYERLSFESTACLELIHTLTPYSIYKMTMWDDKKGNYSWTLKLKESQIEQIGKQHLFNHAFDALVDQLTLNQIAQLGGESESRDGGYDVYATVFIKDENADKEWGNVRDRIDQVFDGKFLGFAYFKKLLKQLATELGEQLLAEYFASNGILKPSKLRHLIPRYINAFSPEVFKLLNEQSRLGFLELTGGQIAAMDDEHTKIYTHYLNIKCTGDFFPLAIIENLKPVAFTYLDFTRVPPDIISSLKYDQISSITGAQFVVMSLEQLGKFSALQVSWISDATIQDMGRTICKLTPAQLRGITHTQAPYILKTQWEGFKANQSGFLAQSVAGSLNANVINAFSDADIAAMPSQQFVWISLSSIKKLSTSFISKLSAKQVWAMSADQMNALGRDKARAFSDLIFQGMGKPQWEALDNSTGTNGLASRPVYTMTADELRNVSLTNLALIPPSSIALLSNERLSALTSTQCLTLTASQYMALSDAQQKHLTTKPAVVTPGTQIFNISAENLALLPAETIASLNIIQFRALSKNQVHSLTIDQMQSLLGLLLNGLTAEDIKKFSKIQIDAINVSQLTEANDVTQKLVLSAMSESISTLVSNQINDHKRQYGNYDPLKHSYKTPVANSTTFRNLYQTATASRTFKQFGYNLTSYKAEVLKESVLKLETHEYFKDFKATLDASRSRFQGLRGISTLWSLAGVASAFSKAAVYDQHNKIDISSDLVQGFAWLASALQVPWTTIYSAFSDAAKAEKLLILDKPNATQADIMRARDLAWEASVEKGMGGKSINEFRNRLSGLPATATEKSVAATSFNELVDSKKAYKSVSNGSVEFESIPSQALYADTFSVSDFKEIKLLTGDKIWENFKSGGAIFLVANIMNVVNSGMNLRDTIYDNSLDNNPDKRRLRLVFQSLGLVGGASMLVSDMISMLAVDTSTAAATSATAAAARASTAMGALGLGLIVASGIALTIYSDVDAFKNNSTQGAKVALAMDCVGSAIQLSMLIGAVAFGGPFGAVVMLAVILLPNWGAVGNAVDLADTRRILNSQGRYAEGNIICYYLHQIAALNATPIVNLGSAIYTPIIMNRIYNEMTNGGFLQALQEDYSYYIHNDEVGSAGKKVVNEIMGSMKTVFDYRIADDQYLTDMRFINLDSAEANEYYAYGGTSYYWSMLDVHCDQNGAFTVLTDVQWIASTVFINDNAQNSIEIISISGSKTNQTITVDARGSSQDMVFNVETEGCIIYGGSGKNSYVINSDDLPTTGFQIYGTGKNIHDTVQFIGKKNVTQINLDNLHNAYVQGTDFQNNVWGNMKGQIYQYGGGVDRITMLGGNGSASVGGRGSYLRMAGGNNTAFAVLGFTLPTVATAGFYDGGTTTLSKDSSGQIVGENTINFSGSCQGLLMSVVDTTSNSEYSSASTLLMGYDDVVKFTNFHNLVGSSFGDNITLNNTTNINQVVLGAGNNDVTVNNSKGVSIISGDSLQNKIYLNNSDVAVSSNTGSVDVKVGQNTKLYSILNGVSDVIDASKAGDNFIYNGLMEAGSHTIKLNKGVAAITVLPDVENSTTFVYEESTVRDKSHLLSLTLGEKFEDALFRIDDDGVYFIGKDDHSQELNYFVDDAVTLYSTTHRQAADITKFVSISSASIKDPVFALNLLIQAAASMSSTTSAITTIKGNSYYNLSDVVTLAKTQHPIT